MSVKKILIVITKGEVGGAQNFVLALAKALKENGCEVTVGIGDGEYLYNKLSEVNIRAVCFKYLKRTHNPLKNILFAFEMRRFLNLEKFDVVHFNSSNTLFGALGAKMSSIKPKTVFTYHGLSLLDPNYKAFMPLKVAYFLFFKVFGFFIDKNVFVSENNFEIARNLNLAKNASVIYNGIETISYLNKKTALGFFGKNFGINLKDKFIIGSVGRLAYPKNYEFLTELMPKILKVKNNAVLLIIGDGPKKNKYLTSIKELGIEQSVLLTGGISEASRYLKAFDLFALPSIYEGLSIALIEALGAGIPILASNVGGNPEILINNEELFESGDSDDFLNKLKNICLNDNLSDKLAKENKKISAKFSSKIMAENYKRAYEEVLSKSS